MNIHKEQDDEKDEIVRGFIIEKDFINQEHEKEKKEIVDSFIHDREELIEKFNDKVSEIERKFNVTQQNKDEDGSEYRMRKGLGPSMRRSASQPSFPMYLNFGGESVLTPEEFLSNFQLEDKFENEQDGLERTYRDEKRILKDKLELEYNKKLQYQRFKYEAMIEDLRRMIKDSKSEKDNLDKQFRQRLDELETFFDEKKRNFESNQLLEQRRVRENLEVKHSKDMELQRENYERLLNEFKEDRNRDKELTKEREKEISRMFEKKTEDDLIQRKEMSEKMRKEFQVEYENVVLDKTHLAQQVLFMTEEKNNLAGQIKQLHENRINKMEVLEEFSSKLNREYEERLKKTVLENERLRFQLEQLQHENLKHVKTSRTLEQEFQQLEDKTISRENLIVGYKDKISSLREENNQLSKEILVLRKENDDSRGLVENYRGIEGMLNDKLAEIETENEKTLDRCKMQENERLNLERKVSLLMHELQQGNSERELLKRQLKQKEDEVLTGNRLLAEERKEHSRFNARFQSDAADIRRKDHEYMILNEKLRSIEKKIEKDIDVDAEKVDREMQLEARNSELGNQLLELDGKHQILLKEERGAIQKQFAKEFAKRLQVLKRNYEEATDGLIRQIRELRQKISELENSFHKKTNKSDFREVSNFSKGHTMHLENSTARITRNIRFKDEDFEPTEDVYGYGCSSGLCDAPTQRKYQVPVKDRDLSQPSNKTFNMGLSAAMHKDHHVRRRSDSPSYSTAHERHSKTEKQKVLDGHITSDTTEEIPYDQKMKSRFPTGHNDLFISSRQQEKDLDEPLIHKNNDLEIGGASKTSSRLRSANGYDKSLVSNKTHKQFSQELSNDLGHLTSLPPICRSDASKSRGLHSLAGPVYGLGHEYENERQVKNESQTKKLEKSVERLQETLESSHSQMLQRIENIQNSERHETSHKNPSEVGGKMPKSKMQLGENDLQNLLNDVRTEVTRCNQLLEKHENQEVKSDNELTKTSSKGDFYDSSPNEAVHDMKIFDSEARIARKYATDLNNQLQDKKLELRDTNGALKVVYKSQGDTASELPKNKASSHKKEPAYSHGENLKENIFIDKLVSKLQERLSDNSKTKISPQIYVHQDEDYEIEQFSDALSV